MGQGWAAPRKHLDAHSRTSTPLPQHEGSPSAGASRIVHMTNDFPTATRSILPESKTEIPVGATCEAMLVDREAPPHQPLPSASS